MANRRDIGDLINSYKESKTELDALKKDVDSVNKEIKEYLIKNDIDSASSDKWTAKITKSIKETLNQERAIEVIKNKLPRKYLAEVIQTVEVLDEKALEKLIYENKFNAADLDGCKDVGREVITLRISKKKGK